VTAAFVRNGQVKQVAGLVGTIVGAGIATIALGLPLLVGGLGLLALTATLVVVMPEHNHRRAPADERGSWHVMLHTARAGVGAIRGKPVLVTFLGLWGVFALCSEGLDRLWEAHLLKNYTFPTFGGVDSVVWFGAINVALMLGSVILAEVVRRTVDTSDGRTAARILFAFSAVRIVGVVLFGLAGSFEVAVGAYLVSMVFRSVSQPIFTGWVNRSLDPRTRATVLSMGGQVDAAGQLTGGPVIGMIGQLLSLRAAMVAAGLALAPALPLIARAMGQERGSARPARLDQPLEVA
jgi:DHA3 family tetracycline resistance protein-like MFS transporter